MSETTLTPAEHFAAVRAIWLAALRSTRVYLGRLDGETSRSVGRIVLDIVNAPALDPNWADRGAALFVRGDPDLWHEIADSRKR
jgi:hypothetical protein